MPVNVPEPTTNTLGVTSIASDAFPHTLEEDAQFTAIFQYILLYSSIGFWV